MSKSFTFRIEHEDGWFTGICPEVPGANGQGRTLMSCSRNLVQAVALILEEECAPLPTFHMVPVKVRGSERFYRVELLGSLEGFAASCPELPGCFSQGDEEEEALANIQDAIKDYIEVADEIETDRRAVLSKVA